MKVLSWVLWRAGKQHMKKKQETRCSLCVPKLLVKSHGNDSINFPLRAQELHLSTPQPLAWTPGMKEQENPGFFCCVSLLPHANEKVSALQCWGTSCRCVSDAQFNEWSKVANPDTFNKGNGKRDTWTWVKRESFTPLTSETHYQALLLKPKRWRNSEKDELFIKEMQVFSHITNDLKNKIQAFLLQVIAQP